MNYAKQIIEIIEATGDKPELLEQERHAIELAVPLLIKHGYLTEIPLAEPAVTVEAFREAQDKLLFTSADTARLLGCSIQLVDKMRAGSTPIRPLVGFVMANLPRRIALSRLAQSSADSSTEA